MGYEKALNIIENVNKAVKGKSVVVSKVLMAILAKGHILMEDIPGVGKTTLALALQNQWTYPKTECSLQQMYFLQMLLDIPCITVNRRV